jgi:hypothetical protein
LEARRGIYIDFEGRQTGPPVLLGVLWVSRQRREPRLVRYVVDPGFRSAAAPPRTQVRPLSRAIELLVKRATDQGRLIIGWSSHELDIVQNFCPEMADRFETVYRDSKRVAKRWRSIKQPDLDIERDERKRKHRLDAYAAIFGLPRPMDLGLKDVGMALGRIGSALESSDFGRIADRRKLEWEMILRHNEFDCRATRHVCISGLEALGEGISALTGRLF